MERILQLLDAAEVRELDHRDATELHFYMAYLCTVRHCSTAGASTGRALTSEQPSVRE